MYRGIWGKVIEGTKSNGYPMTNLLLSRPSKPQSKYISYHVIGNRRNDYKHSNNCKTVRVDYFLNVIYLKKLLSSLKHCYFPSPTVTFLHPEEANVRLLSFNIPPNSPEIPSRNKIPYFCSLPASQKVLLKRIYIPVIEEILVWKW